MTKTLLALHVIAAIVAIGPVTAAASMFPAALRRAMRPGQVGQTETAATLRVLHRICRVYALLAVAVPVFGYATASTLHVLGSPWLIASIALTGVAAVVLGLLVLPGQDTILAALTTAADNGTETGTENKIQTGTAARVDRTAISRLAMTTGLFNLLWATVTVLMIVRPGSTTGV
jgi:hypothetical protein